MALILPSEKVYIAGRRFSGGFFVGMACQKVRF
nr:MAG TPA: hypothetical protein [Caudoviricetes sp.]